MTPGRPARLFSGHLLPPCRLNSSIERYHADKSRDSNTSLKYACDPARSKKQGQLIYTPHIYGALKDGLLAKKDSAALIDGSMFHAMADGSFDAHYAVHPDGDNLTRNAKAWKEWEAQQAADRPFVRCMKPKEVAPIRRMYDDMMRSEHVQRILKDTVQVESSIWWNHEATEHPMKSRPDIETATAIPDFKTSVNPYPDDWKHDCYKLGYFRSAALLQDGVRSVEGVEKEVINIVVPKDPPHIPVVIRLAQRAIEKGRAQNDAIIRNVAEWCAMHREFGMWPLAEWHNRIVELDLPDYAYQEDSSYGY